MPTLKNEVTYAQLIALIDASGLKTGLKYTITDFQTVHTIPNTAVVYSAPVEQLTVEALSTSAVDIFAKSATHPEDIICLDLNPDNWSGDSSFQSIGSAFRGVIYFRHDQKKNIKAGYDWRGVKYRRWKHNAPAYSAGTTYAKWVFIQYKGFIYSSKKADNVGNAPSEFSNYWLRHFDLSVWEYLCPLSTGWYDGANNVTLPAIPGTYVDILTFGGIDSEADYSNAIKNVDLGRTAGYIDSILTNNVIKATSDPSFGDPLIYNIYFGDDCHGNTLIGTFSGFRVGDLMKNGIYFAPNLFGNVTMGNNAYDNIMSDTAGCQFGHSWHTQRTGSGLSLCTGDGDNYQSLIAPGTMHIKFGGYCGLITLPVCRNLTFLAGDYGAIDLLEIAKLNTEFSKLVFLKPSLTEVEIFTSENLP